MESGCFSEISKNKFLQSSKQLIQILLLMLMYIESANNFYEKRLWLQKVTEDHSNIYSPFIFYGLVL